MFVAAQVAKAAGLKNPKAAVNNIRVGRGSGVALETLVSLNGISPPLDALGKRLA